MIENGMVGVLLPWRLLTLPHSNKADLQHHTSFLPIETLQGGLFVREYKLPVEKLNLKEDKNVKNTTRHF